MSNLLEQNPIMKEKREELKKLAKDRKFNLSSNN